MFDSPNVARKQLLDSGWNEGGARETEVELYAAVDSIRQTLEGVGDGAVSRWSYFARNCQAADPPRVGRNFKQLLSLLFDLHCWQLIVQARRSDIQRNADRPRN